MGLTLATLIPGTVAVANCPILGFDLPAARQPSTSAAIKMAQANMTAVVNEQIKAQSAVVNSTAFSVEIFSTKEADSLWEYHYSAHADQAGTTHVTKDTIYRIGSVSKLLSMYLWLIEDGDVHWNDPITDFVPELAKAAKTSDGVTHVSWNEVTVGELASHMAGIGRDCMFCFCLNKSK
jgi:CubicO group peptidase (beta-lactamase class C family)